MWRSEGEKGIAWIERCRPKISMCLFDLHRSIGFGAFFSKHLLVFFITSPYPPFFFYPTLVDKACLHAWDSFTPLTGSKKLYSGNVQIVNLLSPAAEG